MNLSTWKLSWNKTYHHISCRRSTSWFTLVSLKVFLWKLQHYIWDHLFVHQSPKFSSNLWDPNLFFGWSHEVSRQKRGEKNQEQQQQQQQQQHDGFKHVSLTLHLVGLLDSPFQEPQAFADLGRCIVAGMFFEWESMECLMEFMFIIINNNNNIIIINQNKSSSIINGKLSTRKATHRNEKKLPLDLWGHDPDSCIFPILIGLFPVTVKMLHVVTPKKGWRLYILVAEYFFLKQTNQCRGLTSMIAAEISPTHNQRDWLVRNLQPSWCYIWIYKSLGHFKQKKIICKTGLKCHTSY